MASASADDNWSPDLGELPKFKALDKWINRLERWCEEAFKELEHHEEKLKSQKDSFEEKIENLEARIAETEGVEARLQAVSDYLDDMKRGVRDLDELYDLVANDGLPLR